MLNVITSVHSVPYFCFLNFMIYVGLPSLFDILNSKVSNLLIFKGQVECHAVALLMLSLSRVILHCDAIRLDSRYFA